MTISVVIPTRGRTTVLYETVDALLRQTHLPDEVVVVDQNGPTILEVADNLPSRQRVRHVKNETQGLVNNYNACIQAARSEIVLFVDDDVVPNKDLIKKHLANYEKDSAIAGVAGRVCSDGDADPRTLKRVGYYSHLSGVVEGNFNFIRRKETFFAQGANMSFRKKVLEELGGFDSRFDGNGYFFETDFGLRLAEAGYKMVFDPSAELFHLRSPSGGARINDKAEHTYHFVKNGVRLFRRHSPSVLLPLFLIRQTFYVFAKSIYNRDPRVFLRGVEGIKKGMQGS